MRLRQVPPMIRTRFKVEWCREESEMRSGNARECSGDLIESGRNLTANFPARLPPMLGLFKSKPGAGAEAADRDSGWRERLRQGLKRTRELLDTPVSELLAGRRLDAAMLEELETALLVADVGIDATRFLLDDLQARVKRAGTDANAAGMLGDALFDLLRPLQQPIDPGSHKPFVIMLCGVNGAGKTTSIGKLARLFQSQGRSVLLAAGDTFRAAAREQLTIWGERNGIAVIAQDSADPAS